MTLEKVEVCVYGAAVLCPSCVNMPSSQETYDWLKAAIARKYPDQPFEITYIDINEPPTNDQEKSVFAQRVIEEDMFYPVVVINNQIVGEGNPRLKTIYAALENHGYKARE